MTMSGPLCTTVQTCIVGSTRFEPTGKVTGQHGTKIGTEYRVVDCSGARGDGTTTTLPSTVVRPHSDPREVLNWEEPETDSICR